MDMIEQEIITVKKYILEGFEDPLPKSILSDFINGKSKMIRSTLGILYFKTFDIDITDSIYSVLAAGEIFHNASLLHDDVLDNAEYRRNNITIAKQYSSSVSILSGDYLVSFGIEKLLSVNNNKILENFKDCVKMMTKAELKQYFLKGETPSIEEYIDICRGKTASLFSTILNCGAILADIDAEKAKTFGDLFGICFQIKNDLESFSAATDQKNGVKTAKDIIGIEKTFALSDNYKSELKEILLEMPDNIYSKLLKELIDSL